MTEQQAIQAASRQLFGVSEQTLREHGYEPGNPFSHAAALQRWFMALPEWKRYRIRSEARPRIRAVRAAFGQSPKRDAVSARQSRSESA